MKEAKAYSPVQFSLTQGEYKFTINTSDNS
jgi:hypothetical protein